MKIDTSTYFKIFKIEAPEDIDPTELKRRFRILIQKYHPDKKPHGNADNFRLIHDAYKYVEERIMEFRKKESVKFYNPNFVYYGDGSIYSIPEKRWVKIKDKKINIKI